MAIFPHIPLAKVASIKFNITLFTNSRSICKSCTAKAKEHYFAVTQRSKVTSDKNLSLLAKDSCHLLLLEKFQRNRLTRLINFNASNVVTRCDTRHYASATKISSDLFWKKNLVLCITKRLRMCNYAWNVSSFHGIKVLSTSFA